MSLGVGDHKKKFGRPAGIVNCICISIPSHSQGTKGAVVRTAVGVQGQRMRGGKLLKIDVGAHPNVSPGEAIPNLEAGEHARSQESRSDGGRGQIGTVGGIDLEVLFRGAVGSAERAGDKEDGKGGQTQEASHLTEPARGSILPIAGDSTGSEASLIS
jgi:hypothetical protein